MHVSRGGRAAAHAALSGLQIARHSKRQAGSLGERPSIIPCYIAFWLCFVFADTRSHLLEAAYGSLKGQNWEGQQQGTQARCHHPIPFLPFPPPPLPAFKYIFSFLGLAFSHPPGKISRPIITPIIKGIIWARHECTCFLVLRATQRGKHPDLHTDRETESRRIKDLPAWKRGLGSWACLALLSLCTTKHGSPYTMFII